MAQMGTLPRLFLVAAPGLEQQVVREAAAEGFASVTPLPGGVEVVGGVAEACRANLFLRTPARVLMRIAEFRALHPAQLDKRARRVRWSKHLAPGTIVRVEATSRSSRIYHAGAAADRVRRALVEEAGALLAQDAAASVSVGDDIAEESVSTKPITVLVRLDDDLCTISLDTSGAPLHRRGHKPAVAKAPMRETLAAGFLMQAGFDGREPVLDPMCGSGTFLLEAGSIAKAIAPGRDRRFAIERLASFDPAAWAGLRDEAARRENAAATGSAIRLIGRDRDAGAIAATRANLARAALEACASLEAGPIAALARPEGPPGLVIVNPPYGGRVGKAATLRGLYATLGRVLSSGFGGWRVALVTSEAALARATGLPFDKPGPPVAHGGLPVRLWLTAPLPDP